jgi:hypothetical protein
VRADEKLSAFVELERQVLTVTFYLESIHADPCVNQRRERGSNRSLLLTRIAAMDKPFIVCADEKSTAFLELESERRWIRNN